MSVYIQRDSAAVNSSFIHSQRMFAALRLFCKHGDTGGFAKPFWSALDGFAYACNRHCAIRVKADLLPLEAAPSDVSHAKTIALFKLYGTEKGTPIGIDLQDLYEAAEVSIAISRGRNGMMDGNVFDERSDMAFVSVPGVGVFRSDYLFDAYRASVLTNCLSTRVSRRDHVGKDYGSFILGIGDSSGCEVLICPIHGGNVRDSRWVVVEAGTLRERVERSFSDIVGVAE